MMILKLILITFEQELTEDEEFSNVVFVKVDCDELEVLHATLFLHTYI